MISLCSRESVCACFHLQISLSSADFAPILGCFSCSLLLFRYRRFKHALWWISHSFLQLSGKENGKNTFQLNQPFHLNFKLGEEVQEGSGSKVERQTSYETKLLDEISAETSVLTFYWVTYLYELPWMV